MRVATIFLSLYLVSAAASACIRGEQCESEPPVEDGTFETASIDRNPNNGRLTISGSSDQIAAGIVVDRATDSIYISANGQTSSYSIPQMAQIVSRGDTIVANEFTSLVRNGLGRADGLASLQMGNEAFASNGGDIRTLGGPNLGGACSFSPCQSNWVNGYGTNYHGMTLTPPFTTEPDLTGYSPEIIAYDKERFKRRQETECDNRLGRVGSVFSKTVGTAVSCGLAETGVLAAVCVLGAGETIRDILDDSDVDLCYKNYPGPGRWEE